MFDAGEAAALVARGWEVDPDSAPIGPGAVAPDFTWADARVVMRRPLRRADYGAEPELQREEVHLIWSEPATATPEQVSRLAAEVLRWRDMVDPDKDDPDMIAALVHGAGGDPGAVPGVSDHWKSCKPEEG